MEKAVTPYPDSAAILYIWSSSHRSAAHFDRLKDEGRIHHCDDLAAEVSHSQNVLRDVLHGHVRGKARLRNAKFLDLFNYLYRLPSKLGKLTDDVTTAKENFEAARLRYNQECIQSAGPAEVGEEENAYDAEFSALDLPATVGGEVFLPDPQVAWVLAGYGILGATLASAFALGPQWAVGVQGGSLIPECAAFLSGLRLVMP